MKEREREGGKEGERERERDERVRPIAEKNENERNGEREVWGQEKNTVATFCRKK